MMLAAVMNPPVEPGDDPVVGVYEDLGRLLLKHCPRENEYNDHGRGNQEYPGVKVKPEYLDIIPPAPVGALLVNL